MVCLDTILQKHHARSDKVWFTRENLRVSRICNGQRVSQIYKSIVYDERLCIYQIFPEVAHHQALYVSFQLFLVHMRQSIEWAIVKLY